MTTTSDGEASALEIWKVRNIPLLQLLPVWFRPRTVVPIKVPVESRIDLFKIICNL